MKFIAKVLIDDVDIETVRVKAETFDEAKEKVQDIVLDYGVIRELQIDTSQISYQ